MIAGYSYASLAIQGARSYQEDACAFARPNGTGAVIPGGQGRQRESELLAVLADGMGGHSFGARASQTACLSFLEAYQRLAGAPRPRLAGALDASNRALAEQIETDGSLDGMGCTLLGASLSPQGLAWVSVGDSPLFLFRAGRLYQLNEDHSLAPVLDRLVELGELGAAEAQEHPRRHFLRSALTGKPVELVDLSDGAFPLEPGDWLILASDGIDTLPHTEIADILDGLPGADPMVVAGTLLARLEARDDPNQDNTTVMAIAPFFER